MTTIAQLRDRALDVDFDTTARSADASRFIRQGIGHIFRRVQTLRGDFIVPLTTSAGIPQVVSTARVVRTATILDPNGDELEELSVAEYEAQLTASPARGRPVGYAITGSGLLSDGATYLLWPTPDAAYTLTLVGRFEPATTDLEDADIVPLTEDYEDLPVAFARWQLFLLEDDDAGAARWQGRWQGALRDMAVDINLRSDRPRVVPGTWSGASSARPAFRRPRDGGWLT